MFLANKSGKILQLFFVPSTGALCKPSQKPSNQKIQLVLCGGNHGGKRMPIQMFPGRILQDERPEMEGRYAAQIPIWHATFGRRGYKTRNL